MIHHWLMNAGALSTSQTLNLTQRATLHVPGVLASTGMHRTHPLEYAQADNSYMYMSSGIDPVYKWDGLTPGVELAGVGKPSSALTLAFSGTGGTITGNYIAYQRFVDGNGNVSNLSLPSAEVTTTASTTAIYSNVPVPTDLNQVRRQILRNAAGSFFVFYIDIDTTDLSSSTFTSTSTDDDLRTKEFVALFDPTLTLNLANFHAPPPADKPLISYYQNRLWLYGTSSYSEGMAQVTNGSTTVTGIGTEWTSSMVDRLIYFDAAEQFYTIDAVNIATQVITLEEEYRAATDNFALYTIQSAADRRHLLCYSEATQPDSWNPLGGLVIASSDDLDDEGTALISTQSFLFAVQRRHIYRLTFFQDPSTDGGVFLSARRGCVNNRCWISAGEYVYMLDDRGIYRFNGIAAEELSNPIQDIFFFDRPEGELRLNWSSSRYWHAHHDRNDATLRFFVGLSGQRYPRHCLAYNIENPQWWLEEYPWPIIASSQLQSGPNPIPLVASKYNKVFAVGIGTLDDLSGSGDTLGEVESAGVYTLTAPVGFEYPSSLPGTPVGIVSGRGKGQLRIIASISGQELTFTQAWGIRPDETSKFRIGAIPWEWKSQWSRWNPGEIQQTRRVTATFQPAGAGTTMDLRIYEDYSETPNDNFLNWPNNPSGSSGVTTAKNDPDAVVDLALPRGFAYLTLDSLKAFDEYRRDVVAVEVRGFSGDEAGRLYQIDVEGAIGPPSQGGRGRG